MRVDAGSEHHWAGLTPALDGDVVRGASQVASREERGVDVILSRSGDDSGGADLEVRPAAELPAGSARES